MTITNILGSIAETIAPESSFAPWSDDKGLPAQDIHSKQLDIGGLRYGVTNPERDNDPDLINKARDKLTKVLGDRERFD